ncbi:MAG: NUDIX hydrolase [Candidatus Nephthysia bennettiae]|uniref:NUDIX hydrolase n=1 Tax=Candidatus Nephthysia bennettiae TaxID=3127016 RepID=A0A934JZR8_9BACT|nr:NUDIX hydrolase [Candidatus Dormibacteraeota bacterium]MBJ7611701.1 NUDIX hydrolase [Candidatus Dormibacteraeota bacterium]PZR88597.1 MAG: NUDIX hydrolase [Candidatus Dormibacteraeota bacterium]
MAREIFTGKLISVRVDERGYELVGHPPAVVIVAVERNGTVWLVRSQRPVPDGTLVEVPAGLVDPDESVDEAARRELREECGLEAESWEELASAYSSPGFTDERIHVYLATGLRHVGGEEAPGPVQERFTAGFEQAVDLCAANLQSLAALLLASRRLARRDGTGHRG